MRENMKVPLLHMNSWRGLWVGSIIVAQKIWDDIPLKTSSFKKLLPNVSKHDLNKLERNVLQLLAYSTCVKPSMYARIYFELNEIYNILSMSNNNNSCNNNNNNNHHHSPDFNNTHVRPLSIVRARLLHIANDPLRLPSINPSYHHQPTTLFSSSSSSLIVNTSSLDSTRNASSNNNNMNMNMNTRSLGSTSPISGIYPTSGPSPKSKSISIHNSPSMTMGASMMADSSSSSSSTIQMMRSDTFVPNDGRSLRGVGTMNRMMIYDRPLSTLEDVTRTDSSFFVLS